MFTGIVQSQADVISLITKNNICQLKISLESSFILGLSTGASVAINGVCLTTVEYGQLDDSNAYICFDIIDETLRVSNLSALTLSSSVNVERSLKVGDEIGGHMVSGHVHCQGKLVDKKMNEANCTLYVQCEQQWLKYILSKGFITVNGTSLTVGEVKKDRFGIHLIPETLNRTNLGQLALEQYVNLEFDQQTITIVNTIERMKLS